jgi:hypothetical protein
MVAVSVGQHNALDGQANRARRLEDRLRAAAQPGVDQG